MSNFPADFGHDNIDQGGRDNSMATNPLDNINFANDFYQ